MMVLIGMLAYEFPVILPVVAKETFHGGPETYGFMTAAMGVGSVAGGLAMAGRGRTGLQPLVLAAAGFGVAVLFAAFAPTLVVEFAALAIVGWVSIWFFTRCSSTLQLAAEPSMRGRVMALWAVAYQGTTPIGGPVIGWISAQANPRVAFAVGGIACLVASLLGLMALRASGRPIHKINDQRENPAGFPDRSHPPCDGRLGNVSTAVWTRPSACAQSATLAPLVTASPPAAAIPSTTPSPISSP